MPTLNKNIIKPNRPKNICSTAFNSSKYYNSMAWIRLRKTYLIEHPVCESCLQHCHIEPATDIHHKHAFSKAANEDEAWDLFLSQNNLMSLCECCHYAIHKKMDIYNMDTCSSLTEKEYEEAHNR